MTDTVARDPDGKPYFTCCDRPHVKYNGGLQTCLTCKTNNGGGPLVHPVRLVETEDVDRV